MAEYIAVSTNQEHIDRHFVGSLVPGSKFLPMDALRKQNIIDTVDSRLAESFQSFLDQGKEPSRVVLEIDFPQPIGTDALVLINSGQEDKFIEVTRDAGTANESRAKISESEKIPVTNKLTVIAGPYGPGNWGIYTMFPGNEAPPFPNAERQSPEAFKSNTDFWETHGFLATPAEVKASRPQVKTETLASQSPKPNIA